MIAFLKYVWQGVVLLFRTVHRTFCRARNAVKFQILRAYNSVKSQLCRGGTGTKHLLCRTSNSVQYLYYQLLLAVRRQWRRLVAAVVPRFHTFCDARSRQAHQIHFWLHVRENRLRRQLLNLGERVGFKHSWKPTSTLERKRTGIYAICSLCGAQR